MSISSRLWLRCFDSALASATSPFVISLTRGSLPKATFKAYIAQDAFYLGSFKKAFADAATICRKDSDVFGVGHFETMGNLIDTELKMHAKFALELNIDLTAVSPFPQTLLYTDFLGAAGTSNYVSHICAAMTPCMTLYGFLGRRAKIGSAGVIGNPYEKWIEEYSSFEFSASSERLEMLLDHYAAKDGQNYDDLLKLYAKAMELEYNFFSAHETASWTGITPRFLGIDFDDTISAGDTISTLCKGGLKAQGVTDEKIYSDLLVNYVAKYEEFMALNLIEQSGNNESKVHRKIEFETFMQTYSTFEDSMLTPVENSLILQGLSSGSLDTLAEGVKMKVNAIETIKYATNNYPGVELHVLSVNWSKKFLGSMLNIHMPKSRVMIHANELQGLHGDTNTAESISSGAIERKLTGPQQKGDLLKSLLSVEKSNGDPTVYIGDSLGDLSALLEADLGIIIGTSSSLRKVCSIYGISVRSLDDMVLNQGQQVQDQGAVDSKGRVKNPTLYVAESWAHIGFCLFGKQYVSDWLSNWTRSISLSTASKGQRSIPKVLCIAGSDSGGGAGIQADIKTCSAFNVFSTTAITSLTAQNTLGVTAVDPTTPEMLRAQLDAVLSDIGTDAVKTGMIPSGMLAKEIARAITKYAVRNVVVDPVMVSTSGSMLMDPSQARDIVRSLFPLATLVTPNIPEAMAILKLIRDDNKECEIAIDITSVKDMEDAARGIYGLGSAYVLVKGGHLAPTNTTGEMVDVLYDGQKFTHIKGPQVSTENVHGTGCTLSSAIASELARGSTVLQAVLSARKYLTQTLEMSAGSTIGTGSHGPLLHMAPLFANVMPVSTTNVHAPMDSDVPRVLNPVDLSVYAVTDPSLNEKYGHTMEEAVAAAVAGGATIVQIREKNITTAEFIDMSRRVLQITRRAGVPLIINDRVDVALAIGADGVHVGQSDMNAAEVRRLIGPGLILGVSTKSPEEALKAQADGADYVGSGAVYPTNTKVVTRELGVDGLKGVCSTPGLVIPVVAIGGISGAERVNSCLLEGGAQGVAVVSAIFGVADVYGATLALTNEVKAARQSLEKK